MSWLSGNVYPACALGLVLQACGGRAIDGIDSETELALLGGPFQLDADGDGYGGGREVVVVETGQAPPEGYVRRTGDCDDSDPSVFRTGYVDADGDGYLASGAERCVGSQADADIIFVNRGSDCNDADFDAHIWYGPDADGDGFGSSVEDDWLCTSTPPTGYLPVNFSAADCADAEPAQYPGALETFDDGIDSDCDGEDSPPICHTELAEFLAEPEPAACSGLDLAVLAAPGCSVCFGQAAPVYVRVANVGQEGSDALELEIEVDEAPQKLAIPALAPGEMSPAVTLISDQSVFARLPLMDCEPSNNTISMRPNKTSCTL